MRVTVNNDEAARAVPEIVREVDVPVIGDFHYNGHLLLAKYPACARALAKYRINPGNVGGKHHDENFATIVQVAIDNGKPVRIGVNWGSLDQHLLTEMMDANAKLAEPRDARDVMLDAIVESAIRSAELAEATGLGHDRIILSAKVSGVQDLVDVYRRLAPPLRLSAAPGPHRGGHGHEGHRGEHRRAGHPAPGGHRRHDPRLAHAAARRRPHRGGPGRPADPAVAGAPELPPAGDGLPGLRPHDLAPSSRRWPRRSRPTSASRCRVWRERYPGVEELKVAVMGCVVNGPGESKHANIGISLPGTFEEPKAPVYVDGKLLITLKGDAIVADFLRILDDYVDTRFGAAPAARS